MPLQSWQLQAGIPPVVAVMAVEEEVYFPVKWEPDTMKWREGWVGRVGWGREEWSFFVIKS